MRKWETIAEREKNRSDFNPRYDAYCRELAEAAQKAETGTLYDRYELMAKMFYFGYAQGRKAERSRGRKV